MNKRGRLKSTTCIYSCLVDYYAEETNDFDLLLCALEALCLAAKTAVTWACLLANLWEEWTQSSVSVKIQVPSTGIIERETLAFSPGSPSHLWWHLVLLCYGRETLAVVGDTVAVAWLRKRKFCSVYTSCPLWTVVMQRDLALRTKCCHFHDGINLPFGREKLKGIDYFWFSQKELLLQLILW